MVKEVLDHCKWVIETYGWWALVGCLTSALAGLILWDVRKQGLRAITDLKEEKKLIIKKMTEHQDKLCEQHECMMKKSQKHLEYVEGLHKDCEEQRIAIQDILLKKMKGE